MKFQKDQKVRVIKANRGHGLPLNSIVKIIRIYDDIPKPYYEVRYERWRGYYLYEDEVTGLCPRIA